MHSSQGQRAKTTQSKQPEPRNETTLSNKDKPDQFKHALAAEISNPFQLIQINSAARNINTAHVTLLDKNEVADQTECENQPAATKANSVQQPRYGRRSACKTAKKAKHEAREKFKKSSTQQARSIERIEADESQSNANVGADYRDQKAAECAINQINQPKMSSSKNHSADHMQRRNNKPKAKKSSETNQPTGTPSRNDCDPLAFYVTQNFDLNRSDTQQNQLNVSAALKTQQLNFDCDEKQMSVTQTSQFCTVHPSSSLDRSKRSRKNSAFNVLSLQGKSFNMAVNEKPEKAAAVYYQSNRGELQDPQIISRTASKQPFDNDAMRNYLSRDKAEMSPNCNVRSPQFDLFHSASRSASKTPLSIKEKAYQNIALGRVLVTPERGQRTRKKSSSFQMRADSISQLSGQSGQKMHETQDGKVEFVQNQIQLMAQFQLASNPDTSQQQLAIQTKDLDQSSSSQKQEKPNITQPKYPRAKACEEELEVLTERSNEEYSPQVRKVKLHKTPSRKKIEHYPSSPSLIKAPAMNAEELKNQECRSEWNQAGQLDNANREQQLTINLMEASMHRKDPITGTVSNSEHQHQTMSDLHPQSFHQASGPLDKPAQIPDRGVASIRHSHMVIKPMPMTSQQNLKNSTDQQSSATTTETMASVQQRQERRPFSSQIGSDAPSQLSGHAQQLKTYKEIRQKLQQQQKAQQDRQQQLSNLQAQLRQIQMQQVQQIQFMQGQLQQMMQQLAIQQNNSE